jgi:hypothetical protein
MYSAADGFLPIMSCFVPQVVYLYANVKNISRPTTRKIPQFIVVFGNKSLIQVA